LPPGFKLVRAERTLEASGRTLEHLVLSDGLAAISIYAEADAEEGLRGGSRIGAIHAHGGKVAGHQITVVGEAPAATVAAVFSAIKPQAGGTP
jgi:sigma-E factor negative regulatory protein RseB